MPNKRITYQQKIGNKGQLQIAEMFTQYDWQPRPLSPDLGEDLIVDIYDNGVSAGLAFYVQIKSSEDISKFQIKNGNFSYLLEVKDLMHWQDYLPPVFILLWDTSKRYGHWIMANEIIKELDKENPKWRKQNKVKVRLPSNNTTGDTGLKGLRKKLAWSQWDTIRSGKNLEMKFDLSFPNDPLAKIEEEGVRQFLAGGETVTISGKYITKIQYSDWYERKFGKPEIHPEGKLVLGPTKSERVDKLRLTFLSLQGNIVKTQNIEIKATRVGNEKITFSNEHLPTPFLCNISIEYTGLLSMTMSLKGSKTSAQEALIAYDLFEKLRHGGRIRVEVLTNAQDWGEWGKNEIPIPEKSFPELDKSFKKTLQKLSLIEQKTGVVFSLGDKGIDEKNWRIVNRVYEIIQNGRLESTLKNNTFTLSGPSEPDASNILVSALCQSHDEGKPFFFNIKENESWADILGVKVPLGPKKSHANGSLTKKCVRSIARLKNSTSSPQTIDITVENGNYIEEYLDWLTSPSELPDITT